MIRPASEGLSTSTLHSFFALLRVGIDPLTPKHSSLWRAGPARHGELCFGVNGSISTPRMSLWLCQIIYFFYFLIATRLSARARTLDFAMTLPLKVSVKKHQIGLCITTLYVWMCLFTCSHQPTNRIWGHFGYYAVLESHLKKKHLNLYFVAGSCLKIN